MASTVPQSYIEPWLSATLRADSQLATLAPGGVYADTPPAGRDVWPTVVYVFQSSVPVRPAGQQAIGAETRYFVKCVDKQKARSRCFPVAQRILDLLDDATAQSGDRYVFGCQYVQDVEFLEVTADGTQFQHVGQVYEIVAR